MNIILQSNNDGSFNAELNGDDSSKTDHINAERYQKLRNYLVSIKPFEGASYSGSTLDKILDEM
jgi:hypothetical protein